MIPHDLKFENILSSMGMNNILADLEDGEIDFEDYGDDDNEEESKTSTVDTSRPVSKSSR